MSLKRSLPVEDEDGVIELEPSPKRAKKTDTATIAENTNGRKNTHARSEPTFDSPSKKRRLEEDGLVIMDGADDRLDHDVIEID